MLEREMMSLLDKCYDGALEGILPGERTVEELAEDYLMKNSDKEKVAVNTLKKVVVAPQKIKSLVLVKEIFLTTDVNRKN